MKFFLRFIVIIACSSMLIGWSFGTDKPKKSDIENEFKERMPDYLQLSSFDVDIIENLGNKVDPRWGSRFKAVVKTNIPLYEHDEKQEARKNRHIHGPVIYLSLKTEKNTKIDIYGKAESVKFKDKWKTNIDVDERIDRGKSLIKIKKDLEDKIIIIRGSNEEKELRKNLSHTSEILIGTWRGWVDYSTRGTYRFNPDGTYYGLRENAMYSGKVNKNGTWERKYPPKSYFEYKGDWTVEGNKLNIYPKTYRRTEKSKRINGKLVFKKAQWVTGPWKKPNRNSTKWSITYVNQNTFISFQGGNTWHYDYFVRIDPSEINKIPVTKNNDHQDLQQPKNQTGTQLANKNKNIPSKNKEKKAEIERREAAFWASIDEDRVKKAIKVYYDTQGEWAGRYIIAGIKATRLEKKTDTVLRVHAAYTWQPPGRNTGGDDIRYFDFQKINGRWQVTKMGGYMSGRLNP